MKTKFKKLLTISLAILLVIQFLPVNAKAYERNAAADQKFMLLQEIIQLYTETSLYETDADTLINQMIYNYIAENPYIFPALVNSLLSANDRYSAYYPADYGFLSSSSKSFGIVLKDSSAYNDGAVRRDGVYIDEVIPDSNAEFCGILPGDRFVSVEGINVEHLTLDAIKRLLSIFPLKDKKPEDSPYYEKFTQTDISSEEYAKYTKLNWDFKKEVSMVFERILSDGSVCLMDISLPRGVASIKELWLEIVPETQTANIQITSFHNKDLTEKFKEAVEKAVSSECKNLIIDLRDNGGGYSDIATEIADMFTAKGNAMYYTRKRDQEPVATVAESDTYFADKFERIVVLTNGQTASAAELLAYIIQEQAGAAIIGETTFGKALGQDFYSLANGDNFTITSLEILKTDLTSYNEIGISPTVYAPIVPKKFDFPENLSVFNYLNYTEIRDGETNDPTLALEQRLNLLGILKQSKVDGLYDEATKSAVLVYQIITNEPDADGTLTLQTVANITDGVNYYKDFYVYEDSQLAVANLYIKNKSQGKRLASEYIQALKKYNKMLEQKEAENLAELEKLYKEEAQKNLQEGGE